MNLAEYQRALIADTFALEPSGRGAHALGAPPRFELYRHMMRTRLVGMAQVAFKQALAASGEPAFAQCFARYLAKHGPRSPLIRDVVADFAPFARVDPLYLAGAPRHLADTLRFEEQKWRLAYQPALRPVLGEEGVRELDFEGVPVLNPVFALLRLDYPVQSLGKEGVPMVEQPQALFIYRPSTLDEVRWYVADPFFAALIERAQRHPESLAELVRNVASERAEALDGALLETLSSSITLALQRGVLIGVR